MFWFFFLHKQVKKYWPEDCDELSMTCAQFELGGVDSQDKRLKQMRSNMLRDRACNLNSLSEKRLTPEQLVILRQCYANCRSSSSICATTPKKQIFHARDLRKSIHKMQTGPKKPQLQVIQINIWYYKHFKESIFKKIVQCHKKIRNNS